MLLGLNGTTQTENVAISLIFLQRDGRFCELDLLNSVTLSGPSLKCTGGTLGILCLPRGDRENTLGFPFPSSMSAPAR